jgi:hypothetical protein
MPLEYGDCDTLGQAMFQNAQLGDRRRTARAVKAFDALRRHPGGTLPVKVAEPMDLKALYRLCDCDAVTHEALLASLRAYTLRNIATHSGAVLLLHDTTELNYTSRKAMADELGQIGDGHGRGLLCHNVLAVDASTGAVLGLMNQRLHRRPRVSKNELPAQRRERASRESRLWTEGSRHSPAERRLVDVADQGADCFEFFEYEVRSGRTFVIRVHYDRKTQLGHDGSAPVQSLSDCAGQLSELGGFTLDVQPQQAGKKQDARKGRTQAEFVIRGGGVTVHPPHFRAGDHGRDPFALYLVSVTEQHPPKGEKPIVWLLLTNEPVLSLEDAWRVTGWYEKRWIVEEYHKAMKTGCGIEDLQFTAVARLEPMIAMLSAVALTLLDLRDASRRPDATTRRATTVVDREIVAIITAWRYGEIRLDVSVHDFYLALARLGGHQNRRNDHPPGWLVLWRGWTKLQSMLLAHNARKRRCG